MRLVGKSAWILAAISLAGCGQIGGGTLLKPGTLLPELEAGAWINGSALSAAELAGKVVVVDVWASW